MKTIVSRGHSRPLTEIQFVEDGPQRVLLASSAHGDYLKFSIPHVFFFHYPIFIQINTLKFEMVRVGIGLVPFMDIKEQFGRSK